jgi:hypothetical protein
VARRGVAAAGAAVELEGTQMKAKILVLVVLLFSLAPARAYDGSISVRFSGNPDLSTQIYGFMNPLVYDSQNGYWITIQTFAATGFSWVWCGPMDLGPWDGTGYIVGSYSVRCPASSGFRPGDYAIVTVNWYDWSDNRYFIVSGSGTY